MKNLTDNSKKNTTLARQTTENRHIMVFLTMRTHIILSIHVATFYMDL